MEINDIVVYLSLGYGIPFVLVGVMRLSNWIIEMLMIKRGYFKIRIVGKNSRSTTKLLKPKGGGKGGISQIDIGDKKHPRPVPYTNAPGWMVLEGSTPIMQFDAAGNQLPFVSKSNIGNIDKDYFSDLMIMSYNLGNIMAKKDDKTIEGKLTLILIAAAAAALFSFLAFQGVKLV